MERKLFHKAKLATAIALVSTTTLLTGCLVDGNKSNTSSTTVQEDASRISITDQATPLAQILGLVQDTNGNPVVGASVSIGSATATTDANGAYAIANVPVTGFTGGTDAEAATAIQVSIVPAAGFLSATVSVSPQASTIVQTVDGASGNTEDALLAIVTTDGLAVSAGIAVVPALQSTVTGYLRDDVTGIPVANTVIGLDLLGVNGVAQEQEQNDGSGTSYGTSTYQAATDADGMFILNNLPVDAEFDLAIEGWQVDDSADGETGELSSGPGALGGEFATTPEVTVQNIGTITATKIISTDVEQPFVISVNGVVSNVNPGLLNDDLDGTQGLVINFSEPLQDIIDDNSVYVFNTTREERIDLASTPALSSDGKTLTVTTSTAIPEGEEFDIYLNVVDFQDPSGNAIKVATVGNFEGKATPAYDSTSGLTISTVSLHLKTYADPVTAAGAVVGLSQLTTDGGDTAFSTLLAFNGTFSDIDTGSLNGTDTTIEQLNSAEAAGRLKILSDTIYADSGIPTGLEPKPTAVSTSVARIQFTLDTSTVSRNYLVTLFTEDGVEKTLTTAEIVESDEITAKAAAGDSVKITVEDGFEGDIQLLVKGVDVNDKVVISSLTDFGTVDEVTAPLILTDVVGPTTVIQSNYGSNVEGTSIVQVNYYGNGGELTSDELAVIGSPLLNITPRMLVPQAGELIGLPVTSIWNVLTEDTVLDIPTVDNTYDAAAFALWSAAERARSIGIALSENVSLSVPAVTFTGTNLSTGMAAQNDVFVNDLDVGFGEADLIKVDVPDIVALSQTDHGAVIDLTAALTDTSGNAAIEAKVVLQDRMPAMLESALYNGDEIVLTFNEAVTFEEGDTLELGNKVAPTAPVLLTLTADDVTMSAGNTVMTIDRAAWGGEFDLAAVFDLGSFDHDNDGSSATPTPERGLTYVDFNNLEDLNGNTWSADNAGAAIPYIIIPDNVGEIDAVTTSNLAQRTAGISQTVTYSFTHAIDVDTWLGAQDAGEIVLSGTDVETRMTLSSVQLPAQSIDTTDLTDPNDPTTGSSIVISADRKLITVTLIATQDIPANTAVETHSIDFDANLPSLWSTGTLNVDAIENPAP